MRTSPGTGTIQNRQGEERDFKSGEFTNGELALQEDVTLDQGSSEPMYLAFTVSNTGKFKGKGAEKLIVFEHDSGADRTIISKHTAVALGLELRQFPKTKEINGVGVAIACGQYSIVRLRTENMELKVLVQVTEQEVPDLLGTDILNYGPNKGQTNHEERTLHLKGTPVELYGSRNAAAHGLIGKLQAKLDQNAGTEAFATAYRHLRLEAGECQFLQASLTKAYHDSVHSIFPNENDEKWSIMAVTFEGTPDKYELLVMNNSDHPITIRRGDRLGKV
jgi:hypothetical protein